MKFTQLINMVKTYIFSIALAATTLTAMAQKRQQTIVDGLKFRDNWHIGINGGVGGAMKSFSPNLNGGLRIGKDLTPAVGLGFETNYYVTNKVSGGQRPSEGGYCQVGLYGDLNLTNTFSHYRGDPENFELYAMTGLYWGHNFGDYSHSLIAECNILVHKIGFDVAYNFGPQMQWQLYLEPAINYALTNVEGDKGIDLKDYSGRSYVNINLGLLYKFKNYNGTHNFELFVAHDEKQIASLNETINELRNANRAERATNDALRKKMEELTSANGILANNGKVDTVTIVKESEIPYIYFAVGKSEIPEYQMLNIHIVGTMLQEHKDWKLRIDGYASTDGSMAINQTLSVKRAKAIRDILVKKYGISPDRLITVGCGPTGKLFTPREYNRVGVLSIEK